MIIGKKKLLFKIYVKNVLRGGKVRSGFSVGLLADPVMVPGVGDGIM